MQSNRMGWPGAAEQVAYRHPAPPRVCATPRVPEDPELRAKLRALDVPPNSEAAPAGESWRSDTPGAAGWYIVGSLKDGYSQTNRAYFDGARWVEFVGLIDPAVRGIWDEVRAAEKKVKWLRPCRPGECGASTSKPDVIPSDTTDADGWVAWEGGPGKTCPVSDPNQQVEIHWRTGAKKIYDASSVCGWERRSIVAYRLVK